jgi:hypothetical protein
MSENTILDLDALMDANLDEVVNVPDYVIPPDGVYTLAISDATLDKVKNKEGKESPVFIITYRVEATKETKGMPVADGSLFSERFQYTEEGLKYFKRAAKNILNTATVDGVSIRDILATLKDNPPFTAVITVAETTSPEGKKYENVRVRPVHEAATA